MQPIKRPSEKGWGFSEAEENLTCGQQLPLILKNSSLPFLIACFSDFRLVYPDPMTRYINSLQKISYVFPTDSIPLD